MQKDAYYFPHFSNARTDRKLKRVRKKHGNAGYGVYFMILEVLRDQTDFKYPVEDIDLLADEFGASEEEMGSIINDFELFEKDEQDNFYSPKQIEFLRPYLDGKKKKRIGGIKGNLLRYGKITKEELALMSDDDIIEFDKNSKNSHFSHSDSHTEQVTDSHTDRSTSQMKVNEMKVNEMKVNESKYFVPDKFISEWNKISGINQRTFISSSVKLKVYNKILARHESFGDEGFNRFFEGVSDSEHIFNKSWFTVDYCIKDDESFEKVINRWMEWGKGGYAGNLTTSSAFDREKQRKSDEEALKRINQNIK